MRLTYANVMATAAMFVALGGGAYAVIAPRNSVSSSSIQPGAVNTSDIAKAAVDGSRIDNGSIGGKDLSDSIREDSALSSIGRDQTWEYCDPGVPTLEVVCGKRTIKLTAPGRVLLIGTAFVYLDNTQQGDCALYVDNHHDPAYYVGGGASTTALQGRGGYITLFGVSGLLPAGEVEVGLKCTQQTSDLTIGTPAVGVVTLGAN